ncbi:MAG: cytochrome c oxidase subunit I [bacterium JZ-2024 1]
MTVHGPTHHDASESPHEIHPPPRSFWRRYIFSIDHKIIGLQYFFTSLFFLFVGGTLALLFRWQLAYPGKPFPILGPWLLPESGSATGETYAMLVTMHGMIMVFFFLATMMVSALGNYFVPLMIGARDMAFPFLNMISYWLYLLSGIILLFSFGVKTGAAAAGWTLYPPLSGLHNAIAGSGLGTDLLIISLAIFSFSSLFTSINILATVFNLRAPNLTWFRLPLFVWSETIVAFLVLLAFPVAVAGFIMLLADRNLGTSFFLAQGHNITPSITTVTGGSPILYQHLFWFLGHPEVYVLILPAMGIASEVISVFSRKPVFGYHSMAAAMAGIAFLGFIVWAHHMFVSGMNPLIGMVFMTSTMLIALPSGIKVFNWLATLWRGSIRFTTPMLYALGFVSLFIIGGLSGLFNASMPVHMHIHDTYFVVAHFHYIVFGAALMGMFAAIHYWFPKIFGRMMNDTLGKVHFVLTFISLNLVFFPMHYLGTMGHMRRIADPTVYDYLKPLQPLHIMITHSAIVLGLSQLLFLFNFFYSARFGKKATANPWNANTLEWQTDSPVPYYNFLQIPVVYHGPYEYGRPDGNGRDFLPQTEPAPAASAH